MHAHKSVIAMAAVHDCCFKLLDHSSYSPDLTSSDNILFLNIKKTTWLVGITGQTRSDNAAVKEFFRTKIRVSIPQVSKDSSILGGSMWTKRETNC